ncbi:GTPase Era [Spirochaetia bacterium]|nr:GTPase Era [Spirochaetia bacterium]
MNDTAGKLMAVPELKKAAFVAVIGRPSVGKSTLVNLLCGEKVAIVSAVPQTTRNAIRGIVNRGEGQLVFVDTPGRHASEKKLNKKLMSVSDRSMEEADLILYVLDASRPPAVEHPTKFPPEEDAIACRLLPLTEKVIVAINKIDARGADCEKLNLFLQEKLPGIKPERCFKVSALKDEGTGPLLACLFDLAPTGDAFYPADYYTDQDVQFRIAEIIREKAISRLREELPHSLYVDVADTELRDEGKKLWIRAFIVTERESQKGMVVGKGGEMIKSIRQAAQKDLNRIFEWKIELDLRVKTAHDWRHNDGLLKKLIDR